MKKIICQLLLLSFPVFVSAQLKKTYNEVRNSDKIEMGANTKLEISAVNAADKNKFTVKDEAGNAPAQPAAISYNATARILSIDLSATFNAADNISFLLSLPDNTTRELAHAATVARAPATIVDPAVIKSLTGIAYWDARAIQNLWNHDKLHSKDMIKKFIDSYCFRKKSWSEIAENPFFKKTEIIDSIARSLRNNIATPQSANEATSMAIPGGLAGLDVTKYVQAFADFLRDRIKEELTVAYLKKLKDKIEASEELKYLLPKTREVFLKNDIFQILKMGDTYKKALASDLEELLPNIEQMVLSINHEPYLSLKNSDGFIGFMTAYHFVDMTSKNYHPAEIIKKINSDYGTDKFSSSKVSYGISVINMLSQNVLDTSGKGWIATSQLRNISKDEVYLFLGLMYEKNQKLFEQVISGTTTLETLLNNLTVDKVIDKVYDLLMISNSLDERIKAFKNSNDKSGSALTYFVNNADALTELYGFVSDLTGVQPLNNSSFNRWKSLVKYSLDAAKAVKENDLGKVGANVIMIINELDSTDKVWKKDLAEFIRFMTDITNAKESADIKKVIENYAAPVHSYRVARTYKSSTSIAAYPGLYGGVEYNGKASNTDGSFGVTAPIGIAFSWKTKKEGSNSLFVSVFDIGAALSYRFNNDTADLPQKVYLGQIFSPGLAYVHGFKNSPLALKLGIQYAPLLRNIKDGNNVYIDAGVWRFGLGLSVDIPLLILSRKQ